MSRISMCIGANPAEVSFKPAVFLGGALWNAYISSLGTARFDRVSKSNCVPRSRAAHALAALQKAGFEVEASDEVKRVVEESMERHNAAIATTEVNMAAVDAELAKRGLTLRDYQKTGVRWLAAIDSGLLADDMGLGKTIQVAIAMRRRAVVVGPAVAKGVWLRELNRWRPDLRVTVLSGRGSFRWPEDGEVIVTNYDILTAAPTLTKEQKARGMKPWNLDPTIEAPPADVDVVFDEAHALKNGKSKRTEASRQVASMARKAGGRTIILTATPMLNRPPELWAVLQAGDLAKRAFGSWDSFVRMFRGTPGFFGGMEWGDPREEEVGKALSKVMLRRMKTDVLTELPAVTFSDVPVALDRAAAKAADSLIEALKKKGKTIDDLLEGRVAIAFEQWSSCRSLMAKAKVTAAMEMVEAYEESGEPIVVFSAHVTGVLDQFKGREGWALITGETKPEERTAIEDAFQRGELKGIAGSIKAAGVAITLTRAANALFIDEEVTPALNNQARDRLNRMGQTRGVNIVRLVADHPLDQRVAELNRNKANLIEASVEQGENDGTVEEIAPDLAALFDAVKGEKDRAVEREKTQRAKKRARYEKESFDAEASTRPAKNAVETWAGRGILMLADMDPDRAQKKNDMGFDAAHGAVGHWLATELMGNGHALTDAGWQLAIKVASRFTRQVGDKPEV